MARRDAAIRKLDFVDRKTVGPSITLTAVGDIGFAGRPEANGLEGAADRLLGGIRPILEKGDIVFANFEGVLSSRGSNAGLFVTSPEWASVLADAGFNVLHLANNHVLDLGPEGLVSTLTAVEEAGLIPLGVGLSVAGALGPVFQQIAGIRLGWLAAGRIGRRQSGSGIRVAEIDKGALRQAVTAAAPEVDCLIVSLHFGYMWIDYPSPAIRSMALNLAEAGARLILMHHPHVLQGVEVAPSGAVICYSLGNFLFDWELGNVRSEIMIEREREGGVFRFVIDRKGVAAAHMIPTWMEGDCSVVLPESRRAGEIIDRVRRISADLESDIWKARFFQQRARRNTGHGLRVLAFLAKNHRWGELLQQLSAIRPRHAMMFLRWCRDRFVMRDER